jgi:flavin reductase (DIM6/NTAB) family NADH-FMN oxidoreductase RutF
MTAMNVRTRHETLGLLANRLYTVSSSNGRQRGAATVRSVSYVSATPLLVMASLDPRSRLFDCLAESRRADVRIVESSRVLHCLVRHIVRVSAQAIVILEVVDTGRAA